MVKIWFCLFICLPVCLPDYQSVFCSSIRLSVYLSAYLFDFTYTLSSLSELAIPQNYLYFLRHDHGTNLLPNRSAGEYQLV